MMTGSSGLATTPCLSASTLGCIARLRQRGLGRFKTAVLRDECEGLAQVVPLWLVQALEKKQDDDVAHGEIETAHPGYLGSQDTFYVGTIKGVGRIYQQTFSDTYSKWAAAKLCTTKMPITPADLLNDEVLAVRIEAQRIAASRNRMATSCIWP